MEIPTPGKYFFLGLDPTCLILFLFFVHSSLMGEGLRYMGTVTAYSVPQDDAFMK